MNYFPTQAEMLELVWLSLLGILQVFTLKTYVQRFKQRGSLKSPRTKTGKDAIFKREH